MKRCFFHVGEMEPCWRCAQAHAAQREEDRAIVSERRLHDTRSRAGRANGGRYGKRPPSKLPRNRNRARCGRGHLLDGTNKSRCRACDRDRNVAVGRVSLPLVVPMHCTVCGGEFVRRFPGQKRCDTHIIRRQRSQSGLRRVA